MLKSLYFCDLLTICVALSGTKILKFQDGRHFGSYSIQEWARFKGEIPHLDTFTVCHWEKLAFFSVQETCPWSFCYKYGNTFDDHHCTQLWYDRDVDSGGRYVMLAGGFGDGSYGGKFIISMKTNLYTF